jgi:hypothetical protein
MTTLREMSPNDLANLITISSSALGTVLLVLFKSRCKTISFCCGLWKCDREVQDSDEEDEERANVERSVRDP